jgi:hypothetical protein
MVPEFDAKFGTAKSRIVGLRGFPSAPPQQRSSRLRPGGRSIRGESKVHRIGDEAVEKIDIWTIKTQAYGRRPSQAAGLTSNRTQGRQIQQLAGLKRFFRFDEPKHPGGEMNPSVAFPPHKQKVLTHFLDPQSTPPKTGTRSRKSLTAKWTLKWRTPIDMASSEMLPEAGFIGFGDTRTSRINPRRHLNL